MSQKRKLFVFLTCLIILFVIGVILSLLSGPVKTNISDLCNFLFHHENTHAKIFVQLRLTRLLLAFCVGASLGLSGAILQGYFQNSMAGPYVVGVSSGASLGAVFALFLGLNVQWFGFSIQNIFAFLTAFLLVILVYILSQRKGVFRVETLLLTGIAAGALASALTSFLIFMKSESFEQAVFWLLGSFHLADWKDISLVLPYLLICLAVAHWLAKDMNLLALGDETARSLGCPVNRVRKIFLAVSTLLAAVCVSVSGIIGFVGLVVPHWVRILIGPDHKRLFFYATLTGGVFLIYCDLIARTILFPTELPIGIITAAVGAPFFIYLLSKKR